MAKPTGSFLCHGSLSKIHFSFCDFCFHLFRLQKSSWIISVELAIGPEEGISYLTDKGCSVSLPARPRAHPSPAPTSRPPEPSTHLAPARARHPPRAQPHVEKVVSCQGRGCSLGHAQLGDERGSGLLWAEQGRSRERNRERPGRRKGAPPGHGPPGRDRVGLGPGCVLPEAGAGGTRDRLWVSVHGRGGHRTRLCVTAESWGHFPVQGSRGCVTPDPEFSGMAGAERGHVTLPEQEA